MPRVSLEQRAERDARVMRLYLSGNSYREIGRQVGLSCRGVQLAVKRHTQYSSRAATQLEEHVYLERLETLLRAAWPQAIAGDLSALERCRRRLVAEARFFGVNPGD